MKLYYLTGACPLVTHIVLEWTGQSYEAIKVEREELKQEQFLKLNPLGQVPVLTHNGQVLTQTTAILEYLAELSPASNLLGGTTADKAEVRRWLSFCNADVHPKFGFLFGAAKYSDNPQTQQELAEKATAILVELFKHANNNLEGKQWLTGARSLADPYLYVLMRWAKVKQVPLDGMNNLKRFFDNMDADAGVQIALKQQGLIK